MVGCTPKKLVLLSLREHALDDETVSDRSIRAIAAEIGLEETLAAHLRLASTLSILERDGLVTGCDTPTDGDRPRTYALTSDGAKRADELRERLAGERVVVVDGDDRRELELGSVPDVYGVSLVTALSLRSADGAVYLEPDLQVAFVGRDDDLGRLHEVLDATREDGFSAALLTGDAGVGKSALLERVLETATERGFATAIGRCRRDGGAPYHPFRDAFATVRANDPFSSVGTSPALYDEATYEMQLTTFHERVTTWLERQATDRPLVLAIEDLQWADAATRYLLEHLLAADSAFPIAVLCTCRTDSLDSDGTLASIDARIESDERSLRLDLEPLDHDGVTELVERHVGRRGVPPAFVDAIAEQSGGNPLFVVEIVESMLEDGSIDPTHGHYPDHTGEVIVSDLVQTTIGTRLDSLDANTRAVLEAGAIVGDVVSLELLQTATGHARSTLRAYVDRVVDARLWQRVDDATVRFTSEVVRSVVRDAIDDERASRLHRRIADWMVERDRWESHATIGYHYERSGELECALDHWIVAGERATAIYAHDDAIEWYERALWIAREHDREETVLEILESLGDVYYTRGEYDTADKHFRYIRERTDDLERIRRTYRYQARVRFERGDYEATERYAAAGLEIGADEVTREVCWLHDYHAGSHQKRGNLETATEGFSTQRELATQLDDDLLLGRAYQNLSICLSNRGETEHGLEYVERAIPLLEAAGDDRELARCLNDLAGLYFRSSQFDQAVATFQRSRAVAGKAGIPRVMVLASSNLGAMAVWRAEWGDGRSALEEAYEVATRMENEEIRGFVLGKLAVVERETGHLEEAIDTFERSLDILLDAESRFHCAQILTMLGHCHVLRGAFDRAAEAIDRAIDLATEHGFPKWRARGMQMRGCLERERDSPETAIPSLEEALERTTAACGDFLVAIVRTELCRTLNRAGEPCRALRESRTARDEIPDSCRLLELNARIVHAGSLWRTGSHEDARTRLEGILASESDVSNLATVRCRWELGQLDLETGATERGRAHLVAGRELADEIGATLYVDRFDGFSEIEFDGSAEASFDELPTIEFDGSAEASFDIDPERVSDTTGADEITGSVRRSFEGDGKPGTAER